MVDIFYQYVSRHPIRNRTPLDPPGLGDMVELLFVLHKLSEGWYEISSPFKHYIKHPIESVNQDKFSIYTHFKSPWERDKFDEEMPLGHTKSQKKLRKQKKFKPYN
jgi:hypothetical protein